jgi:hypothetical protein
MFEYDPATPCITDWPVSLVRHMPTPNEMAKAMAVHRVVTAMKGQLASSLSGLSAISV